MSNDKKESLECCVMPTNRWTVFFLGVCVFVWWALLFYQFRIPSHIITWDTTCAMSEFQRKAVVQFLQFPSWNPYVNGGEPWLGHPASRVFDPFFVLVLLFGTVPGTLVTFLVQAGIGVYGVFFVCRQAKVRTGVSLVSALFFLHMFTIVCYLGPVAKGYISLVPWVYFLLRCLKESRYDRTVPLVSLALLMTIPLYAGAVYIFIMLWMCVGLCFCVWTIQQRTFRYLWLLSVLGLLVFGFGSFKVLPMIEVLKQAPRSVPLRADVPILSWDGVRYAVCQLRYFLYAQEGLFTIRRPLFLEETLNYHFSLVAIVLLAISFFCVRSTYAEIVVMLAFFIVFALGDNSPVNLWRLCRAVPGVDWLRRPSRFFMVVVPLWGVAIALTLERFFSVRGRSIAVFRRYGLWVVGGLVFCTIATNTWQARELWRSHGPNPYVFVDADALFTQAEGREAKMFEAVSNDRGFVNSADDSLAEISPSFAVPIEHPAYRGEYYFARDESGAVLDVDFSPNVIRFVLEVYEDAVLVVNQNYYPGWSADNGQVINHDGCIGVVVQKGVSEVCVSYRPPLSVLGAIITGMTFFISVPMLLFRRRKKGEKEVGE